MKRIFIKSSIIFMMFLSCAGLFAQQKFALVIGNGTYTKQPWTNLRNAMNDAADMKTALEKLGFKVDYITNGNLDKMQMAVINLKQKLKTSTNSYGFFYYAGHGAQNKEGHNYLIPVDAETPSLNLLPQRALPVQFVLDELEEAKNELNMIVLDACRDVPALERGTSRGLSVMGQIPRGSIVMYATAANKTASDGTGRNGLFTSHLLNNLNTAGLTVDEVFKRTGSDVAKASGGDQYPEIRLMYFETAYLGSKPQAAVTTLTPQQETAIEYCQKGIAAYGYENNIDKAIEYLTQSIKIIDQTNPYYIYAYIYRGRAYMEKGLFTQARADTNKALQIDPYQQSANDLDAELKKKGY